MPGNSYRSPLLTDLDEPTMAASYFENNGPPNALQVLAVVAGSG